MRIVFYRVFVTHFSETQNLSGLAIGGKRNKSYKPDAVNCMVAITQNNLMEFDYVSNKNGQLFTRHG